MLFGNVFSEWVRLRSESHQGLHSGFENSCSGGLTWPILQFAIELRLEQLTIAPGTELLHLQGKGIEKLATKAKLSKATEASKNQLEIPVEIRDGGVNVGFGKQK